MLRRIQGDRGQHAGDSEETRKGHGGRAAEECELPGGQQSCSVSSLIGRWGRMS